MTDSFTDKLIKDLDQDEKDAKRAGVSRLAVLKETVEYLEGPPVFFIYLIVTILTLAFIRTTYGFVTSYNQIPKIEEGIFQVFEAQGLSVEILDKNSPLLSEVVESVEVSFVELGEMGRQGGMVYYSRKPSVRFFVVDEYWSVVYYYVNDRLYLASRRRVLEGILSPVIGVFLLFVVTLVYKQYKIKYKEMVGL